MFTRKPRHNYGTGIFAVLIIGLCVLIGFLIWPETPVEKADADTDPRSDLHLQEPEYPNEPSDAVSQEIADQLNNPDYPEMTEDMEDADSSNADNEEENGILAPSASYYLVKRSGSQIVVFFCDSSGNMVPLETTEILYSMLGPEDQKLFDQGIQLTSQEELSTLLQDFEG